MIDIKNLNVNALPSLPLEQKAIFPEIACIYFAIDLQGGVQYIGRTINMQNRWLCHHKEDRLRSSGCARIAYLECPRDLLANVEAALIAWFVPPLNIAGKPNSSRLVNIDPNVRQPLSGFLRNKIKTFLEARQLTTYQFIKETGIAPATGYKLAKKPEYLPGIRVLEVICDTYRVQPSELLEWVEKDF